MSEIRVPDIGGDSADVIEILVKPGDAVSPEQTIVVLESAKASMEVPCPEGGMVASVAVTVGQSVAQGDLLLVLDSAAVAAPASASAGEVPVAAITQELEQVSTVLATVAPPATTAPTVASVVPVKVPDIGSDSADVIEILVQAGDVIAPEQPLVVLESAKASMEVPSPLAGVVRAVKVAIGDKVSEHVVLLEVEVAGAASAPSAAEARTPAPVSPATPAMASSTAQTVPAATAPTPAMPVPTHRSLPAVSVHAGPAVRRLARELGVDLARVKGSGPRERILKDDVHAFVKQALTEKAAPAAGNGLPLLPAIDFAKWGEVERVPLSKIQKVSAQNLHRAWVNIPHVTQFDEADITELEAFRVAQKDALKAEGLN
ncbi:MAG: biotin/lipoyl-containing protein, partial [Moraxellaceae bacterium]